MDWDLDWSNFHWVGWRAHCIRAELS